MSIQQSVNNMLATAAVVGGVAKHGIEEEAKNKLQAIDEYFGAKDKLLSFKAEQERNELAKSENDAELNDIENKKSRFRSAKKLNELNNRKKEIEAANRGLENLMKANETSQAAQIQHMEAIKSGKYKKLIDKVEEGGK